MTLFSDKNNNTTIVSPDASDITSSRMHYLHPEYVDEKLKSIYSQSRCPLSMLAETCKNIGKPNLDNSVSHSQEPSVSISPSCSSSCSAPKFSPNSMDYSPADQTKFTDETSKEKLSKEKPKKRKSQKKEPEIANKRPQLDPQILQNHYAISEFLKMNNFARDSINKPDQHNINNQIFNNLINHTNNSSQFNQFPSYWKSKLSHNPGMPFSMNFLSSNYPSPNIPLQSGLYRGPPPNMLHDMNQFYGRCPVDKSTCECPACNRKLSFDKNLMKMEPILFNLFQGLRKERPFNNPNMSILAFLQNSSFSPGASAIKYCMYCGQCIPIIQNLLNHIHTEHIDCINTNLYPKLESSGNFSSNFNIENLQSKDINLNELNTLKNLELLKQFQFMYNNNNINNENQGNNCIDKPVLMK